MQTKVKDVLSYYLVTIDPESSVKEAAQKMRAIGCGVLPVGTLDKLIGVITDRDIALRAVAEGKDVTKEIVRNNMTPYVFYCNAEDTLEEAAKQMHKNHVNRLVVKDNSGKVCGIISFGSILRKDIYMQEINNVIECTVGKKAAA